MFLYHYFTALVFAILLLVGGTWLYCRRESRPQWTLRALDVLLVLAIGSLALLVPQGSVPEPSLRGMVMLLAVNLILYTRAIFIPSSAWRTLTVSAIAALPGRLSVTTKTSASRSGR
jgi:peptidoglycan/LPS O-acetylase OafA/YrhL